MNPGIEASAKHSTTEPGDRQRRESTEWSTMHVKGFGCLAMWSDDDNIISIIENLSHQQANMPYIGTNQLFSTRNLASLCYILFLFCLISSRQSAASFFLIVATLALAPKQLRQT